MKIGICEFYNTFHTMIGTSLPDPINGKKILTVHGYLNPDVDRSWEVTNNGNFTGGIFRLNISYNGNGVLFKVERRKNSQHMARIAFDNAWFECSPEGLENFRNVVAGFIRASFTMNNMAEIAKHVEV